MEIREYIIERINATKYHFHRKERTRLFKVRDKDYKDCIYTVYKVNKKGTMFLIYDNNDNGWQWVYSGNYIPVEN